MTTPLSPTQRLSAEFATIRQVTPKNGSEVGSNAWLQQQLRAWDKGSRAARMRLLEEFIATNQNKTGPELEREYGNGASLLLTRVSAWLRLTYTSGLPTTNMLQAINIFISASSGSNYLTEFVEVGGIIAVLDLLAHRELPQGDKRHALTLLASIADAGRQYKELMCEHNSVQTLADYMELPEAEQSGRQACQELLMSLGRGNPRFVADVALALVGRMGCGVPTAQCLGAQGARRMVTESYGDVHPQLIQRAITLAIQMMKSVDFLVQYEASETAKMYRKFPEGDAKLLSELIAVFALDDASLVSGTEHRPKANAISATVGDILRRAKEQSTDSKAPGQRAAVHPILLQQTACAKLVAGICADAEGSPDSVSYLVEGLVDAGSVDRLLSLAANTRYFELQRQACGALAAMMAVSPSVGARVRALLVADASIVPLIELHKENAPSYFTSDQLLHIKGYDPLELLKGTAAAGTRAAPEPKAEDAAPTETQEKLAPVLEEDDGGDVAGLVTQNKPDIV
eukprot:jgi/Mesvir1/24812/Mv22061-RA.1